MNSVGDMERIPLEGMLSSEPRLRVSRRGRLVSKSLVDSPGSNREIYSDGY
jgi:hypothetical protein